MTTREEQLRAALSGIMGVLNPDDDGDYFICAEAEQTVANARAVLELEAPAGTMREPTAAEVSELVDTWRDALGLSEEEAWELRDQAHIGIVEKYITDGPGPCGTLAMIVWTGGPELMNTAIRRAPGVWDWYTPEGASSRPTIEAEA